MKYYSRRVIKPEDLNPGQSLFGGRLLSWLDEEAGIFAACQMGSHQLVTRQIRDITFHRPGRQGEVIEFGLALTHTGRTAVTVRCEVRNKQSLAVLATVEAMVFVNLDANGRPSPHKLAKTRRSNPVTTPARKPGL
ncbi:acyl-CoA thioesterase [Ferrimonas balearica]|uniref:acyl-CoA thioesterase n=1 Tax=Ferrimonas balearica TaxID=44012 RepID=UPI001C58C342|nr:hotdog domain-containing protein [Ferrimonas balearica]MBW3140484.1 acyl-CoA thioesterase [Ferrimonas balearica]